MSETFPFRGGPSDGEPVVLIHGFSGTWRNWVPVLPRLEREFDVLALGLAGHHECAPLPRGVRPGITALADALERDLDAAGLDTAHLVGNSLGGWLAFELASRGRARSVLGVAPAGGWPAGDHKVARRLRRQFGTSYRLSQGAERIRPLLRRPRFRRLALRDVVAHGERVPPSEAIAMVEGQAGCSIFWELFDAVHEHGPPAGFDDVDVPVLIVWGTEDRVLPLETCAEGYRRLFPDAEWRHLIGLGHVPMYDDPDLLADVIAGHVRGVARAATPVGARPSA